jgi:RNA polymerase sigma factor (sigma-70 family)
VNEKDPSVRDYQWSERIKCGDAAAFEALFRAYYDELCTFAWRYVQCLDAVEDLVQDVFINVWCRRENWILRSTVKAYLYGAVRNEALKYLEHQNVVRRGEAHVHLQAGTPHAYLHRHEAAVAPGIGRGEAQHVVGAVLLDDALERAMVLFRYSIVYLAALFAVAALDALFV